MCAVKTHTHPSRANNWPNKISLKMETLHMQIGPKRKIEHPSNFFLADNPSHNVEGRHDIYLQALWVRGLHVGGSRERLSGHKRKVQMSLHGPQTLSFFTELPEEKERERENQERPRILL